MGIVICDVGVYNPYFRLFRESDKKTQIEADPFRDACWFDKRTWQTACAYTFTKKARK